ncbi:alcohol dehydrogenase [Anaerobacillus arseniciselenatis]|uniref:Alcohol dehydrogenase n=1 Tax=Anaerobacillus arseniciselenatis TaxID=85682 RepID=A0A1S2LBB5_9BACI|nr:iron-containing alcohol dehydrogenase [Anaerobacillus arseniciselenatis]OIJ09333.1 alcohol dehydrogenase [Anaerobacillus arseniciselenatis]
MNVAEFKIANKLITGSDALNSLEGEVRNLGIKKPLIVTDEILQKVGVVETVETELKDYEVGIYNRVKPEPEIELVEDCVNEIKSGHYDGLIAVGGGSAIDIAKAAAVLYTNNVPIEELFGTDNVQERGLPVIAIPTTAGTGSEVTNISILSDKKEQLKKGIVSPYLLPDVALVSPEMTLTMPKSVTAASGIDALVHAIEAFISVNASPITDALALKAIKMITIYLPKAYANPNDLKAREEMVTASLMAGMAFGNAGVGAVHALAYPLGGRFDIPHGISNALLLPYVMEWNKISNLEKFKEIAQAMGVDTRDLSDDEAADKAIKAMQQLSSYVEIPTSLQEFGITEEVIPHMADDASKITRLLNNNPRLFDVKDIEKIYRAAF